MSKMRAKAIFIDKDGTIVDNARYPAVIPTDMIMEDEVIDGLLYLQRKGFKLILISNQPWIAQGKLTQEEVAGVFERMIRKLNAFGVRIDDYYFCPHQSSDSCSCKKPKPKLIYDAARKHAIDLRKSYIIGDMSSDIEAGKHAGIKTILVKTGCGKDFLDSAGPDFIIENINQVSEVIP